MARLGCIVCAGFTILAPLSALAGDPADRTDRFILGQYMPGDVWLFLNEAHNPDRDFIDAHWAKVHAALAESGIDKDIKKLVGSRMSDERRAKFDSEWDSIKEALSDVPWFDGLGKVEFAMGQRIAMPMPNYIFLFRNAPGETKRIARSMVKAAKSVASLSNKCEVRQRKRQGARVWSICVSDVGPVCEIFARGDVIGLTIGKGAARDVLDLMSGESSRESILQDATFKKALAQVDPPEDFLQYMRVTNFFNQFTDSLHKAFKRAERKDEQDVKRVERVLFKAVAHCNVIDYSISTRRTDGLQAKTSGVTRLLPGAKQKPLVRALTERKPFARFDRFVPADATGFVAHTAVNPGLIYHTILEFLEQEIPEDGPRWIAQWNALQESLHGFNLDRDVFDWLSGEFVSVSLPGATGGQMNSVLFVRTSDAKMAQRKVNRLLAWIGQTFEPVTVNPAPEVGVDGFQSIFHPMMMLLQVKPVVGIYEDWLVIGTKSGDVNKCLAVARGEAPSIRTNPRFMREGLVTDGAVNGASFTDRSKLGEELGMMFGMFGMAAMSIPDNEETRPIKTMLGLMPKLAPVVAKINFFNSNATTSRFTGDGWEHQSVTNYKPLKTVAISDEP